MAATVTTRSLRNNNGNPADAGSTQRRQKHGIRSKAKGRRVDPEKEQLLQHARTLLEPLSSLEMLCEADEKMENVIFYMNRAGISAMNLNYKRLNPSLRGADVRKALGHSIHQYHKDPDRIREIFRTLAADSTQEHVTELALGGVTFRLSFTPVCNTEGKVVAFHASWRNISDAKLAEQVITDMSGSASANAEALMSLATETDGAMKAVEAHSTAWPIQFPRVARARKG